MNILEKIYNNSYFPSEHKEKVPQALLDKKWAFYDEIEKVMGINFIEQYWDDVCAADSFHEFAIFREGFRLGVALMLEAR